MTICNTCDMASIRRLAHYICELCNYNVCRLCEKTLQGKCNVCGEEFYELLSTKMIVKETVDIGTQTHHEDLIDPDDVIENTTIGLFRSILQEAFDEDIKFC